MVSDMNRFFWKYLLPLLLLAAGCEKTVVEMSDGGTADLVLNLALDGKPAELALTKASAPEILEDEGLRTLRIIVSQGTPGQDDFKIIYNEKFTADNGSSASSPVLQYGTVTIPDVPVGQAGIYCIGNEESLGKTYNNETITSELKSSPKLVRVDSENEYFPQTEAGIQPYGLPMSGHRTAVNVREGMGAVSIEMKRLAVKLNLIMENSTSSTLTLEGVSYGSFSGDRLYVFPTQNLDVPSVINYSDFAFGTAVPGGESIAIKVGPLGSDGSEDIYRAYIYPTYAFRGVTGENPYTVSLNVRNEAGTVLTNLQDPRTFGEGHTFFRANTQVNIRARITSETDVSIRFDVMDWDEYPIDVPDFE